jgi:hypothetical protein
MGRACGMHERDEKGIFSRGCPYILNMLNWKYCDIILIVEIYANPLF